jgi:bifunctional DNA-binding transcriptional regulator/antitoxin component of YhaV-PrlF toxin-antitoxin module
MSYILEVQEDENGDIFISFPEEITEELGWEEGDILEWNLKGNGIVLSRLNDIAGYEVLED